jgi:trehalose 6-phosphate phosphatase
VWLLHFQVFDLVKLTELYYAGSHGMDIIGPVSDTLSVNHPNCIKSTDQQVFNKIEPIMDSLHPSLVFS